MKIKDYEKNKKKIARIRKIKKETDLFAGEKDYYIEQIDNKTWKYYWFKKENK